MKKAFFIPERPFRDSDSLSFSPEAPWLAPLAGYSDLPFRLLCREQGAAVCETEMLSAKGLLNRTPGTGEILLSAAEDTPLVVQLFGSSPEHMAEAVLMLRKKGYTAFDCNMGCPVRKVMAHNGGAALLRNQRQALELAAAMLAAACARGDDLPKQPAVLGFKFRLAPDNPPGFVEDFGRKLEELGATWLCLHPRTAQEGFRGSAHREKIARLVEAVTIPVIASGDLFSADDGLGCLEETGAATVMYARGSLRNPAIFARHLDCLAGRQKHELTRAELKALIDRHIELACAHGEDRRAFVKMRSIIPRYVRSFPGVGELRQTLCSCENWQELDAALAKFMQR